MKLNKVLVILVLLLLIFTGCNKKVDNVNNGEYKKITAQEAKTIIDSEEVIILDARTQEEYDEGHIENAVLIPVTDIESKAENFLEDKSEKILVYCRSGNRSATASKTLIEMGYTSIYDFGGIADWPYEIVK